MRPTTQRPYTAISTAQSHREASYVVAVIEERGISREVGIAAIDRDTGKTVLIQVTDCQTYVKTLHQIHLHTPSVILVPDSHFSSKTRSGQSNAILIELLQEEFTSVPIEPVLKKYWCETAGLEFLHQLCIDEDRTALLVSASDKYHVLNAVAALFKFLETKQSTVYAARSLRMIYRPIEGTMMIDTTTAKHLELIESMSKKKQNRNSLFGVLNFTYTPMGSRLLRVNLLSPITVLSSIDARLDAVEELVQNEDIYSALKDGLRALNKVDMDKVIVGLSSTHSGKCTTNSFKPASLRITQLLNVRNIVRSLPSLQHCLQGSRCQLLQAIFAMLSDERIGKIEKIVSDHLNDMIKQKGLAAAHARVYAVKANISRLLDVARETYRENVADIYSFCQKLAEEYKLPLKLKYSELHGYSFMLPKEHGGQKLPQGFINITSKGDKWYFSKVELKKKNARMRDSLDEALILSDRIVQELLDRIIQEIGVLYKASEAIALLDMLWSFAHVAILRNYVRPEFTGTLAIKAGRHPIMDRCHSPAGVLIPNDVYSSESSCFQLIQGPNMSGKSSYLRQVALLTILAMCGSFVPAEYASFRIHDTLLTRLSNDDDMARNLSTFASEMASAVMILSLANAHSLILLDELGRGTSSHEGMGMSHAIAEELIRRKSFVFFATHFGELSVTLSRYPSVVNLHLSVQKTTRGGSSSIGMIFKYKLVDGVPEEGEHYGIAVAKLADLPKSLLDEAELVAKKLQGLQERGNERSCHEKVRARRKMLLTLRDQLCQASQYGTLSEENLLSYLQNLQCTAVGLLSRSMDDENTSATLRKCT